MVGQQLNWPNIDMVAGQRQSLRCLYGAKMKFLTECSIEWMLDISWPMRMWNREIRASFMQYFTLNTFTSKACKLGRSIYAYPKIVCACAQCTGCHVCDDECALSLLCASTNSCKLTLLLVFVSAPLHLYRCQTLWVHAPVFSLTSFACIIIILLYFTLSRSCPVSLSSLVL